MYDQNKVLLGTFTVTRGTSPPSAPGDQKFPASGQFIPGVSLGASLTSGYVECDVHCVCIMNFDGSSVFTADAGDELSVPGSTPEEIKAQIRKDPDGYLRRRSIDTSGNVGIGTGTPPALLSVGSNVPAAQLSSEQVGVYAQTTNQSLWVELRQIQEEVH